MTLSAQLTWRRPEAVPRRPAVRSGLLMRIATESVSSCGLAARLHNDDRPSYESILHGEYEMYSSVHSPLSLVFFKSPGAPFVLFVLLCVAVSSVMSESRVLRDGAAHCD